MADIAEIGFRADTRELENAKNVLNSLPPAADKAEQAANKLGGTMGRVNSSANAMGTGAAAAASGLNTLGKTAELTNASMGHMGNGMALNSRSIRELMVVSRELAAGNFTRLIGSMSILIPQLLSASHGSLTFSNVLGGVARQFGLIQTKLNGALGAYAAELVADRNASAQAAKTTATLAARAEAAVLAADAELALALKSAEMATGDTAAAAAEMRLAAAHEAVAAAAGEAAVADAVLVEANAAAAASAERAAKAEVTGLGGVGRLLLLVSGWAAGFGIAFGLAARKIREDNGDVTQSMELTKKQAATLKDHLDRLKDNKIDVHVTGMDSLKGFFKTIKDGLDDPGFKDGWNSTLDGMTSAGITFLKDFYGAIQGTNDMIVAAWNDLPAAFGDVFFQALNLAIDGYNSIVQAGWAFLAAIGHAIMNIPTYVHEAFTASVSAASTGITAMYNTVVNGIAAMLASWRQWPAAIGSFFVEGAKRAFDAIVSLYNNTVTLIKHLMSGDFAHISNPFAGGAAHAAEDTAGAFAKGFNKAGEAIDNFGRRWSANSRKIAQDRIEAKVGTPGSSHEPKGRKGPKTDAEKFADMVTGAQNDIDKENARALAAGIDMTAEASATLAEKTKLLSEAKSKDITLTPIMIRQIDALAAAYGKAKVAADNAVGLHEVLKTGDADIANIKAQADMIGLYGRQLAYATEMTKLLAEAKAKNMTPAAIAAARPQFEQLANQYADASDSKDHLAFMEEQRKSAADNKVALAAERAAIGLNADETNRLRLETELLAAARKKNIDLSPAEIADLKQIADEQAAAENAIRKTKEAIDFAKDTAKGFFTDFFDDLRKGKSLWDSFGDAALNALNKIIDKLLDKAITALVDWIFKSFGYADGGAFNNGVQTFASGGMFTNSVVNRPTPFTFANGAALGVMGEAGPEAIMPLKRGGDGTLGVQMYGNGTGAAPTYIHAPVTVNNDNRVTGAVSSADIVALQKAQGEATERSVKRNLSTWISQYQRDGSIAS